MSAIAGICSRDRRVIDRDAIEAMNGAACLLSAFRAGSVLAGQAALGYLHTSHSGNASSAASLHRGAGMPLWGVADARLDNRPELVRQLSSAGATESDADVDLILKAFATWDVAAFARLVGDFAVAIWDDARERLVCARDAVGVKPLYIGVTATSVTFASQISQILAASSDTPAMDLEYIADHLAFGVPRAHGATTPYRGIARLLPGHACSVEHGAVRMAPYWDWNVAPTIRYRRHEDYALHFLSLFTDAVKSSLRTSGEVWADLSGGLDSSSIVCVAMGALAQERVRRTLSAVTVVFDEAATSDERPWAAAVRKQYGLRENLVDGDRHYPMLGIADSARYWDEPHPSLVFAGMHERYRQLFASNGGSVLLSGAGAEAVVMGKSDGPVHLADLVAGFRWPTLARELRAWQRATRVPFSNLILQYGLRPLRAPRLIGYGWQRTVHPWIRADFSRRFGLRERAQHGTMPLRFASPADQLHYEKVGRVPGFLLRGSLEKSADLRYPFLQRPLVEFMLRVPWDVKLRAGDSKPVLRDAMRGILPDAVRTRRVTTSFGHAVYRGMHHEWPTIEALIRRSRLADLGCVSRTELLDAARLARCGHAPDLHGLMSTLSLEAWLQSGFERAPRATRCHTPAAERHECLTAAAR